MLKKVLAATLIIPLALYTTTIAQAKRIDNEKELNCLAENIYHEAGNQSLMGKIGVAFVTINRSKNINYSNNVCSVVYQKYNGICQFSWVCEGKIVRNNAAYREAKRIAILVVTKYNELIDPTEGALFFHAHYVKPDWSRRFIKTVRIDDHIFYKPRQV